MSSCFSLQGACVKLRLNSNEVSKAMIRSIFIIILIVSISACTPTVQVQAPKEPIEINLNVKIEHHIRVQVDEELEDLFDEDSDVF